jgi:hypothetical protein
MALIVQQREYLDIKQLVVGKLRENVFGLTVLWLCGHVAEPRFITVLTVWVLKTAARIIEPTLIIAGAYLLVSQGVPAWYEPNLHDNSLAILTGAPDIILPGGFITVIQRFQQKQHIPASILGFLLLILTILTLFGGANAFSVIHMQDETIKSLLFWRAMAGIAYSTTILVTVMMKQSEEPANVTQIIPPAPILNHQEIAQHIIPLLQPMLSQLQSSLLHDVRAMTINSQQLQQVEERILTLIDDQKNGLIELLKSQEKEPAIAGEFSLVFEPEIIPEFSDEKGQELPVEKVEKTPEDWSDVCTKFPGVNDWLSTGLKSVSVEQIMEITNYTSQKINRAKLSSVKGGNRRIESVLNWLRNEPVKREAKKSENSVVNTTVFVEENKDGIEASESTNNTTEKLDPNDLYAMYYDSAFTDEKLA